MTGSGEEQPQTPGDGVSTRMACSGPVMPGQDGGRRQTKGGEGTLTMMPTRSQGRSARPAGALWEEAEARASRAFFLACSSSISSSIWVFGLCQPPQHPPLPSLLKLPRCQEYLHHNLPPYHNSLLPPYHIIYHFGHGLSSVARSLPVPCDGNTTRSP